MRMADFVFFCKSIHRYTGSVASIFIFFERLLPVFFSNHFMVHKLCSISVNNVPFEFSSGSKAAFLCVGDIIDLGSVVSSHCLSVFAPLFVLFFNVILACCNVFFIQRLFFALVYKVSEFMFRRKRFFRKLKKLRAPLVHSYVLGSVHMSKSVSYFIRSRATTHTHMHNALARTADIDFGSFVTTVVSTNKEYVSRFLEVLHSLNGF
jgi:hypothetical protein